MDSETWDIIVERFEGNPGTAFIFAQFLHVLKEQIERGQVALVAESLKEGFEKLYVHTDQYKAAYRLYLLALEGNLSPQHDPTRIVGQAVDN
jgi:hypothetical protein